MEYVIAHYGIEGQKWGVRRYQNEDGSLTELGKKHYSNQSKLKRTSIVKKGHTFYRVANSNETLGEYRKYVTDNFNDLEKYIANMDQIDINPNKSTSVYAYTAKHDLHLADSKKVCESILDKHGSKKLSELNLSGSGKNGQAILDALKDATVSDIISGYDPKINNYSSANNAQRIINAVTTQIAEYSLNKDRAVLDDLYAKGYDVIIDLADSGWMSSTPMILLNPEESVNLVTEIRTE